MHYSEFPFDFYLVADFECFLRPPSDDDDESNVDAFHVPSGFCVFRVTDHESYRTDPVVYWGDDVIGKSFSHIFAEAKAISHILSHDVPMAALTASKEVEYDSTTTCANCKRSFMGNNQKMRHHNHVTGKYLFPACSNCNLALKPHKCRITSIQKAQNFIGCGGSGGVDADDDGGSGSDAAADDDDDITDADKWTYLVPIVFHHLTSYDGHFVLQFFRKKYTEYTTMTGRKAYADVGIIPLTGEHNMMLQIGNIVFVDSCQFLATTLDNLVKALRKSGVDKFVNTVRHFGNDDDAYFEKGCYPYEYMTDESKLDETELPPKSAFYNWLVGKDLDDEQYERAKQLWTKRSMTTLRDWHHFYLLLDVLLLADVFEAFRHTMIDVHGLDCLHFPSLPSITLQLALKVTDIELELRNRSGHLSHDAICGGLSYVAQHYALANFPAMSDYRSDLSSSHLLYLDCNSLYTTCQMYPPPVGGFRFLTDEELLVFDIAGVPADLPMGYFVECDLRYPAELHALHNAYPLAPEHVYIVEGMLSDTLRHRRRSLSVHETLVKFARQGALHHALSFSAVLSRPRTRTGQDSPHRRVLSAHVHAAVYQILQ